MLARFLALGGPDEAERLWSESGGGPIPGLDPLRGRLSATPWFPALPELDVELLEGERVSLAGLRGKVVVLDFWATWCQPCLATLPRLQALHDNESRNGLAVLAVNAREPASIVLPFARSLGLRMPIGRYDAKMEQAFSVEALPTVIVADRQGRVRARWDNYNVGHADEMAKKIHELLAEPSAGPVEVMADVLLGQGLLRGGWTRDGRGRIEGLTVASSKESPKTILVSSGRFLVSLDPDGAKRGQQDLATGAGRLRGADLDGDGTAELIGFHRAGTVIASLELDGHDARTWPAPAAVLDAELVPSAAAGQSGQLMLGTTRGLFHTGWNAKQPVAVDGFGEVSDVAVLSGQGAARLVVLEPRRAVSWLDRSLATLHRVVSPPEGWVLVPDPADEERIGVASVAVADSAVGRFLPGEGRQAALAMASGQLLLIDLGSGQALFRAQWEGLEHLAAADLDGDGLEELLVASGRRLTLLRAAGRQGQPSE